MKPLSKALLLSAALFLGACSQNPFDSFGGPGGASGSATGPLDPSSPAYFSETIGDRVFFAVDQSTLTPSGQATLAAQARWLQENGTYTAIIEGHADEQGTREYNLALGARRASAARDYLVAKGVADSRLRTVTFGKERPIEICSSEACYVQNRRAVTVISAGLGS
ncbi:MAG: peptidoglycan-associated lipoprotein Pal [Litoreibacter sp.]|nr:peptidoglycan-associated lipoprotein Pal [Litoreibacter sp.]